ncbi:MAG: GntR family transcriptional regulator [Actinomycetota bacterium]|nr:GntR family transcriptional regulator [Actinomycetota bacterium]
MALEQRSLVDLAVAEIQRLIYIGKYKPGDKLVEEQLGEELGISRPPLREALRELAQRGIVEQLPRRGSRVVSLSAQEVAEIYSLRGVLERFAVTTSFPMPNSKSIEEMRNALNDMTKAALDNDHGGIVKSNRDFHVALVSMANHSLLLKTYIGLMDKMQLCMSDNLRQETTVSGDYEIGVMRHKALLDAIEGGGLAQILEALESHGERQIFGG